MATPAPAPAAPAEDDPHLRPPPDGCPPSALPLKHRLWAWAPRAGGFGSAWFQATIIGGRRVDVVSLSGGEPFDVYYHLRFDENARLGLEDPVRFDVPVAEMRHDPEADPTAPYTKDGTLHLVYRADNRDRTTRFDGPDRWRARRPLLLLIYTPQKGCEGLSAELYDRKSLKATWNITTLGVLHTYLVKQAGLAWVRRQHAQLLNRADRFVKGTPASSSGKVHVKQFSAPSSLAGTDGDVEYDVEHTSNATRTPSGNSFAQVAYWGQLEHEFNWAMDDVGVFSALGMRVVTRAPLRAAPY